MHPWAVVVLITALGMTGCQQRQIDQDELKQYFSKHRVGSSPDYAIVKNGHDYLVTIHGYGDDRAVCHELIEPYNSGASESILPGRYQCVPLNK